MKQALWRTDNAPSAGIAQDEKAKTLAYRSIRAEACGFVKVVSQLPPSPNTSEPNHYRSA
jgi:hypothetical protein